MAMGQQRDRQGEMLLSWDELPKSPGHVFYDRLQEVLLENGFDGFVEGLGKLETFCHRAVCAKGILRAGGVLASVRDPWRRQVATLT